ncbi:hypothetical protein Rt10032_c13g5150 [Rhodotorula toruloides]|uniref:HTH CENPB-type domain-containing protein n=1 Tax=Rhodotorula toruloides TaxID=5286 RepID=A0A511KL81_RHOTO|nr:hypothetical protein Rt10032_c13g5150 [Rhodotorula toruloides]
MSLAEFGFPQQRLRTVSAQLRGSLDDAVAHQGSPGMGSHAWSEWAHAGYSPDRQPGQHQPFFDPCGDLMSENDFDPSSSLHTQQRPFQHGLGFEVQMQMAGIEEEPAHAVKHPREPLAQAYPASNPGSPARSRASSLQSAASTSLQLTALASPASPFFPNPLPSPFHDHRGSFSSTMDPSQSLRGSSPSDSSSVSNLNMSRIESSSATSSVCGGDSASTAPSTPYRSGSLSRQNSQRDSHQKHARRRSSPIKAANRHSRKLSNAERKAICQFHLTHPGWKQDEIGAHFGYERSTISKTLKFKDKYLAMESDDETSASAVSRLAQQEQHSAGPSLRGSHRRAGSDASSLYEASATPQPPPQHLTHSSSVSSIVSLESAADSAAATPPGLIPGGRFPDIDAALYAWAREHAPLGQPLSDAVLQRQARGIARNLGDEKFKASQTWLDGFKHRASIVGGTFADLRAPVALRSISPAAPVPTPTTNSQRTLPPPVEEDEDVAQSQQHDDEEYDVPSGLRRSKRSVGSKTIRRLASAKTTLAAFADSLSRSSSPAVSRAEQHDTVHSMAGGSFGDLSMDSEATPTHSTVHSRASTAVTERVSALAQPFSYSPDGVSGSICMNMSTPSRSSQHDSLDLVLGGDYSPTDMAVQYGSASGLTQPYSPYDLSGSGGPSNSSSQSSLVNYGAQSAKATYGASVEASPAPSIYHRRSGSTASSVSVYSGLTAFSAQNPGTPLTGSLYGSFRDSQGNLCSAPGTPANPHGQTGYFGTEQAQLQSSFLSAGASHTPSSQYFQGSSASSSVSSHPQHLSHQQRYPHSQAYPASADPNQQQQQQQQRQPPLLARRSTISGGLSFGASVSLSRSSSIGSSAMAPLLSASRLPGQPVTLEQAFSSLEIALEYLSTRAGQDYVSPKDLIVLSDLRGKMERARNAQGVSLAAISSAPPTPSGLGPSSASFAALNSPFAMHANSANIASLAGPPKQGLRLSRTQSTSSVPTFGGYTGGVSGPVERGVLTRRSGSALSLHEVDEH